MKFRLPRKKKKQLRKLNTSLTLRIIELSERLSDFPKRQKELQDESKYWTTLILDTTNVSIINHLEDLCNQIPVIIPERKPLDIVDISNHIPNYHRVMPYMLMDVSPLPKPELFPTNPKPISKDWLKLSTGNGYMFDRGQMQLLYNTRFNSI